jgi:hypothetical protein
MDNDEMKNGMENKSKPESKTPNEEIPLWLQGLADDAQEDTQPVVSSDDVKDSWVPEIPEMQTGLDDITEPEHPEPIETVIEAAPESSEISHIDRIIDEDPFTESPEVFSLQDDDEGQTIPDFATQGDMSVTPEDRDNTDEFSKDVFTEERLNHKMVSPIEESPSSEGFVDISNLDLSSEQGEIELDEDALREGELPEWLQEMITESDEVISDEVEQVTLDEPEMSSEPEEVISDLAQKVTLEEPELSSEAEDKTLASIRPEEEVVEAYATEDELIEIPEPEPEPDFGSAAFWVVEEETSPLAITTDAPEEPIKTELIQEEETVQLVDDEDGLAHIKHHIEQGDINQALPLINNLVEQSSHLDTIQTWMTDAAESQDAPKSAIWEVLGDIALKQQQPDVALDAYAKAIRNLLQDNRGIDEIS